MPRLWTTVVATRSRPVFCFWRVETVGAYLRIITCFCAPPLKSQNLLENSNPN